MCVKHSAIDAVEKGFRTFVIVDGCRGVSHEGITKTNKEFVKSGIILLESNKVSLRSDQNSSNKHEIHSLLAI